MTTSAEKSSDVLVGRQLGNFVLVRLLGRGAMGSVYLGYQKTLKRQVAVKLLPKAGLADEKAHQQFRDEAELVAVLSHPSIVPVFEIGEDDEYYFQAMQLVDGADLRRLMANQRKHPVASKRRLPPMRVAGWIGNVLEALIHAHGHGVVHQDIKPANIMIERSTTRALLVDFGIARAARVDFWAEGKIVGTLRYIAPEQAAGRTTDGRADIYALGLVLFEALAGELPLRDREDDRKVLRRKLEQPETLFTQPPSACSPAIDEAMEQIILRAVAPNPADRYPDCRAFLAALSRWRPPPTRGRP